jgi:hypothetical protein
MAIEDLSDVVSPPAIPTETGNVEIWRAIESRMGIVFPADYRDYAITYGTGVFDDPGRLCVTVLNPFSASYEEMFLSECETLESTQGTYNKSEWPYKAFPETPGLLPWGLDDNGSTLLWLTDGPPETWPIMLQPSGDIYLQRIDLPMTSFLAQAFSKQLSCIIWSEPEFFSGPRKVKFAQTDSEIEHH